MRVLKQAGGRPLAVMIAEQRLQHLFLVAFDAKNYRVALKAEIARCRLLGLYPERRADRKKSVAPEKRR